MRDRIVSVVRLVHPFPVSLVVATTEVLVVVAHHGIPAISTLLRAGGVILLSQIAVGALNDYLDRFDDARTQPDKPIPSGRVEPALALALVWLGTLLMIPLALTFGPLSLALASLGTAAGFAYDLWLKPTALSFVGYLVGFLTLFTWVWVIAGHFSPWFLLVYPGGALLMVAAHLAQSFPDIETDQAIGHRGLATLLGPARTFQAILTLYSAAALGGTVLSLTRSSDVGLALILLSLIPAVIARHVWQRSQDRAARTLIFRLIAPGIALLGVASLITLTGPT